MIGFAQVFKRNKVSAHRPIEIAVMYDGYSVSVDGQYCGSLRHSPPHYRGAPFRARRIVMLPHGLDAVREPNDYKLRCFQVPFTDSSV